MFELKIDGIFGLGPPRSDDLCGFESPLYTAYHNKLINKSIFSVYMHNSKDSGNGEYGGGEKGLISLVGKSPNAPQPIHLNLKEQEFWSPEVWLP
ncbi:unnamed protein product [Meloidogyne enterolobii]|uniref:Uncharacterized protein n=1 Tax=Meloidogyne enterolobii TaxID=390850 RepID=A0ACB0YAU8_MELEN